MGVVAKILTALAAALPAIVEWWAKRRAAKDKAAKDAAADADAAAVRSDPKSAWMRDFGSADKRSDRSNNGDNKTSAE